MSSPPPALQAALADRYMIEREVGVGGMATVYLARDIRHDRKVALKVLRPELSAAMGLDRFPREINIIAKLQHPHIVPLYDSGEAGGFLYYVMPYVEGESLRERLDKVRQLSINEGIRLLHEITDALAYAHSHGIIHRDIKPDNVMLSGRHAAVTDFGIAKAVDASGGNKLTTVGIAVGTPHYMAPEQAMADPLIDHRADIYALGALGYEVLSGHPPFEAATSQAVLSAQVLEAPKDIRERRPEIPERLALALLRCLAKDRNDRWQSAEELLTQLDMLVTTPSGGLTPTSTRPFTATATRSAPSLRWPMLAGVAALVLAAAVGGWALTRGHGAGSARIEKIAVLPIEDISGKDSVFVTAMQDALITALLRNSGVGVSSRSEVMRFRGGTKTTREIATELEAGAVVEATVFRAGEVMRINVQFTDPVTSRALWSDTYEKNVSDVLAAQTDIVTRVSTGITGALAGPTASGVRQ
ncbi:MAG: serine/threonine-protein kinase [Gemmatimonadales bacterium]